MQFNGSKIMEDGFTWRTLKTDQRIQPIVIMREPLRRSCWLVAAAEWSWRLWFVHGRFKIGPLTRVIIIAPPTATTVPNIFAWLDTCLTSTFSSLNREENIALKHARERVQILICFCWIHYVNYWYQSKGKFWIHGTLMS